MPNQHTKNPPSVLERLRARSHREGDCMVWDGAINRWGYGKITLSGRRFKRVHVVAYEILVCPVPPGLKVLHSCGRRACWEPSHLRHGTAKENAADRDKDGTTVRGERHHRAVADAALVQEIRHRHSEGIGAHRLAQMYPLSKTQITRILRRQSWSHIT